ncbi:lysophospholipase [Planctomicrobium sp.]|nr:alpha/beta hydrolase [Planctomicrobium sp.]MDB4731939.1 lysophospholipase [bacterium]MDB4743011.1 lysophospholipase [Planctomicrobium sp.]
MGIPQPETEFSELKTSDGLRLHVVEHAPAESIGSVLLVHGLGEHSGRYQHVIEVLNSAGLNVVQFDHRGHGHSEGPRGHLADYDDFLDDVSLVLQQMTSKRPNHKIVLYGHSMGGGIIANWTLRRHEQWSDHVLGVVLSSPWLRLTSSPSPLKLMIIKHLSKVVPTLGIPTKLRVQDLCRDEEAIEQFKKDELNHGRITLKTAWECYHAGRWALDNANNFPVPVLAIHGSEDRITSPEATRQFCQEVPHSQFVPLDKLIHEPHHDPKWREVIYHVAEWVIQRYNFAYAA